MIFTNSRLLGSRRERKIGSWRRVDEKKNKQINLILCCISSVFDSLSYWLNEWK